MGASHRQRSGRGGVRAAAWVALGAVGALAVLLAAAVLALPLLERNPELVARWLGEQLGRPVRIHEIEAGWSAGAPLVRLRGLEVGVTGTAGGGLTLSAAEVRLDPVGSLRARALRPEAVTVRGVQVRLERHADGRLTVSGFGHPAGEAALGLLLGALPADARLGLEDAGVTLVGFSGAGSPDTVLLSPVTLRLHPVSGGVRLSGSAALPASPETPVRFTVRWTDRTRDPLAAADLTVSTRDLDLQALPGPLRPPGLGGRLTLDLDGSLAGGSVAGLRGTAVLEQPRLADAGDAPGAESLHSLVEFTRTGPGWRLSLLRLQAHGGTRPSTPATLTLSGAGAGDGEAPYQLQLDHAPVAALLPLLAHPALAGSAAARALSVVRPHGQVEDLRVRFSSALPRPRVQAASASLRDVSVQDPGGNAVLGPADARLTLVGGAGRLILYPAAARAEGSATQAALDFAAGGELRWHLEDDALVVDSTGINLADGNGRMRVSGSARLPLDGALPVQANVQLKGAGFDAAATRRYLSRAGLPGPLSRWLEEAIRAGTARAFTASVDGALGTPQDLVRALRMQVEFDGGALRYVDGWPELTDLSGTLELDGGRLAFAIRDGRVLGARIFETSGGIADVNAPQLTVQVNGHAEGRTEHGAAFLGATPMSPRFAGLLAQLDARGNASLKLSLEIPLDAALTRVRGVLTLRENRLRVPALRSALESVSGDIAFDQGGLDRGTLRADYLGRRISAQVDGTGAARELTRLTIRGTTDRDGLLRHLRDVGALDNDRLAALPLLSRLSGDAGWQVRLDIPHQQRIASEGIALAVTSDLAGMRLALPAPLGKSMHQVRHLEVLTRLAVAGPRVFQVRYGEQMRAVLEVLPGPESSHGFQRGELRFGGAPAQLPPDPGLHVAGQVGVLSVDEWVGLIAELSAPGAADAPGAVPPMQRLSAVNVTAGHLVALGTGFEQVQVGVTRPQAAQWRIRVRGEALDGEIAIPQPVGSAPIEAQFEYLNLQPEQDSAPAVPDALKLDPQALPPARLVARKLRYNDVDLGLAKLTLSHSRDGLEVRELYALAKDFELRGSGRWTGSGADTLSQLDLRIHSDDFGRFTRALGYGDSGVEGGVAEIAIEARWQGSPFDFALERVRGVLHFRATGGRLRDVEPGTTGRVFGLLNVTVLPRRLLRLDFSDLFEAGVSYERIEGSFRLDSGNAWTQNVSMHTDTARVDLTGRVGLVAQDYDQVMTVTPKLSASLPLAPIWLAEKFLNRKLIDNAFAYRYLITGPWSEPKIERVRVEARPAEAG